MTATRNHTDLPDPGQGRKVDADRERAVMQQVERHVYDQAYFLFLYNPIVLYAMNRAVTYDPSATMVLKVKDASVTDKHRSVRARTR